MYNSPDHSILDASHLHKAQYTKICMYMYLCLNIKIFHHIQEMSQRCYEGMPCSTHQMLLVYASQHQLTTAWTSNFLCLQVLWVLQELTLPLQITGGKQSAILSAHSTISSPSFALLLRVALQFVSESGHLAKESALSSVFRHISGY